MAEIDFNDLINPVGSTAWHSQWNYKGVDDRAFHYSEGNPHMKLIEDMLKSKHYKPEEIGDLYAKAYQWEADQAKWIQQLEVDQAIKQEQREYDNAVNQVARSRAAGINLDVAGSSGGSGSGTGTAAGATSPDNTSSIGRTDPYAGKYYQLAAIQTAAQFAQTMVDSTATIMGAVNSQRMLPSQINLNNAQAGLMDAEANEIDTLLTGKKKSIDLANTNAYLGQLAEMSHLLRPDATDEDFNTTLAGLGLAEEQIPTATNVIRQFHKDPLLLARFAQSKTQQRWSEVENAQYTEELVTQMVDLEKRTEYMQMQLDFETTDLQTKIATLLNTTEYAENNAELMIDTLDYNQDALELQAKQLSNDTTAYLEGLQQKAEVLNSIQSQRQAIIDYAEKQGRKITGNERATLDRLQAEYISLKTMFSNEFYKVKSSFLTAAQQRYQNYYRVNSKGMLNPASSLELYNMHSDVTFNDLLTHTKTAGDIANMWTNTAISAAGVAVDALGVARGYNFNSVYENAHNGMQFKKGFKAGQEGAFTINP